MPRRKRREGGDRRMPRKYGLIHVNVSKETSWSQRLRSPSIACQRRLQCWTGEQMGDHARTRIHQSGHAHACT